MSALAAPLPPCEACTVVSDWASEFCAKQVLIVCNQVRLLLLAAISEVREKTVPKDPFQRVDVCLFGVELLRSAIDAAGFDTPLVQRCSLSLNHVAEIVQSVFCAIGEDYNQKAHLNDLSECKKAIDELEAAAKSVRSTNEKNALCGSPRGRARPAAITVAPTTGSKPVIDEAKSPAKSKGKGKKPRKAQGSDEFNILVIGDLHIGKPDDDPLWDNVVQKFYDDLHTNIEPTLPRQWDLVAVAGDLTFCATPDQFNRAQTLLDGLWERWARKTWAPPVVAIPGNHDLVRPDDSPTVRMMRKLHENPDLVRKFCDPTQSPNDYRTLIDSCFSSYVAWWTRQSRRPAGLLNGALPGEFRVSLPTPGGSSVGIMGLNSAFLQMCDVRKESSFLAVCTQQFAHDNGANWCGKQDVCVLLTHHGHDWLHEKHREEFLVEVYQGDRFALHLCGHQHVPYSESRSERGMPDRNLVVNPSLFGRTHYLSAVGEEERIHGYTRVQLKKAGKGWQYRCWPRKATRGLGWKIQRDVDFDLQPDGGTEPRKVRSSRKPA